MALSWVIMVAKLGLIPTAQVLDEIGVDVAAQVLSSIFLDPCFLLPEFTVRSGMLLCMSTE